MKAQKYICFCGCVLFLMTGLCLADGCPYDHFLIGRNEDGITGNADDNRLFVNCEQIYRHSDPNDNSSPTWRYWHYPMYYNGRHNRYQIGEPGFDVIQNDTARQLQGTPNSDYQLYIECVSLRAGLSARNTDYGVLLDDPGDTFCHSTLPTHVHLQYRVDAPVGGGTLTGPYWMTFRIYDAMGYYQASDTFTLVFIDDPLAGDVYVDGVVDIYDLYRLLDFWLLENGGYANDFYCRTDINRDGLVDVSDFAVLSAYWLDESVF